MTPVHHEGGNSHREHEWNRGEPRKEPGGHEQRAAEFRSDRRDQTQLVTDPERIGEVAELALEQELELAPAVGEHVDAKTQPQNQEADRLHGGSVTASKRNARSLRRLQPRLGENCGLASDAWRTAGPS